MTRTESDFDPSAYPDYRHDYQEEFENAMKKEELTPEDIETLTHSKLLEEADDRDRDIAEGWEPSV